eukprot:61409-Hanusia_phi.AAC.1
MQEEQEEELSEDDLTKKVEAYAEQATRSTVSKACRAGKLTPAAVAQAIRFTCRHCKKEEQEVILSHWNPEVADKFRKEIEEDKELHAEGYMSREGPCMTMTVLGVSSLFVRREEELVEELAKYGLHVDGTKDRRGLIWKAPYRPNLARADEIPVVLSLRRNEAAERFWRGELEVKLHGKRVLAAHVHPQPTRAFKLRAKRRAGGNMGGLAELTHLLSLNNMSAADISRIFQQQLLLHALPVLEMTPNAGMLVQAPARGKGGLSKKEFAAVGANMVLQGREAEWTVLTPTRQAKENALLAFRELESTEGVHLTLMSEDPTINELFAVELMADAGGGQRKKRRSSRRLREDSPGKEKTFDVLVKSTSATGHFSRQELEAMCNSVESSVSRLTREMEQTLDAIDKELLGDLEELEAGVDEDTKSWDGSKIRLRMRTRAGAQKLIQDLPLQLSKVEVVVEAANFTPEEDLKEEGGAGWKNVELGRIVEEMGALPGLEEMEMVSEIKGVLDEVVDEAAAAGREETKLLLDGAVTELFENLEEAPGNVSFLTFGEWTESKEKQGRNVLKEKLRRWLKSKEWTKAKSKKPSRNQGAF